MRGACYMHPQGYTESGCSRTEEWRPEEILFHYGFFPVDKVIPLKGGTANSNFLVEAAGKRLVLRVRNLNYSKESSVLYEQAYLNHLSLKGLPVPIRQRTKDESGFVWHNGRICEVFTFLEGEAFDPTNWEDLRSTGLFLGKLHNASGDFIPPCRKDIPRYDDPCLSMLMLDSLDNTPDCTGIGKNAKQDIEYLKSQLNKIMSELPDPVYYSLPKAVVHGDFHPANLCFRDHAVAAIFDFDWVSVQPRLRDIADGILYFAAKRKAPIDGKDIYSLTQVCSMSLERSCAFVNAYKEASFDSLCDAELRALPSFLRARWIHSRLQATQKVPMCEKVKVLTNEVRGPLEWLDEHEDALIWDLA